MDLPAVFSSLLHITSVQEVVMDLLEQIIGQPKNLYIDDNC